MEEKPNIVLMMGGDSFTIGTPKTGQLKCYLDFTDEGMKKSQMKIDNLLKLKQVLHDKGILM